MEISQIPLHLQEYQIRPAAASDLETAVELLNAYSRALIGVNQASVESFRAEWESPLINLKENSMAVFAANQQMVGLIVLFDPGKPHVRLLSLNAVHPEHQKRGIGTYLVDWVIERARQVAALAPEGLRVVLHTFVHSKNQAAEALLTHNGFVHIRSSFTMKVDFTSPPPAPVLPEGITIRSVASKEEERAALFASYDAFKDHWGHVEEDFENYYRRNLHLNQLNPHHDLSLWFMALDGEEVVGILICRPTTDEIPEMGWMATLGVRRPWRKRGIGLALLQHAFCEFYQRGRTSAGLSVDTANLTGALRLYERCGMTVIEQRNTFELELRAGKDLMTQTLS